MASGTTGKSKVAVYEDSDDDDSPEQGSRGEPETHVDSQPRHERGSKALEESSTGTGNKPDTGTGDASISDDEEPKGDPKCWQFHGLNAVKVVSFYDVDLLAISHKNANITRKPSVGPPSLLTIRCNSMTDYGTVSGLVDSLNRNLKRLTEEEIAITVTEYRKAKEHVDAHIHDKRVVVHFDENTRSRVWVISSDYQLAKQTAHSIKVCVGQIQTKNRARRVLTTTPTGTNDSDCGQTSRHHLSQNGTMLTGGSRSIHGYPSSSSFGDMGDNSDAAWDKADFKFETKFSGRLQLKVYKASITKVKVDAIVNAANDNLVHGGGVARVIAEAAGYDLDRESQDYVKRNGYLKVTGNCLTTAGKLRYKSVIHAVGPQWHMYPSNKSGCLDDLYKTVINVLETCDREAYTSIAMPAISAGIFGVPKETCADMYIKAAVDHSEKLFRGHFTNPLELHIIDVDRSILELIKKSYRKWEKDPSAICPSKSLSDHYAKSYSRYSSGGSHGDQHTGGGSYDSSRGKGRQGGYDASNHGGGASYGNTGTGGSSGRHRANEYNRGDARGSDSGTMSRSQIVHYKCPYPLPFAKKETGEEFIVGESKLTVRIYVGSLVKVNRLDAVVSGIDTGLTNGGHIGDALLKAGGNPYKKSFDQMVKNARSRKLWAGDVLKCSGGKLGVTHVLHLVMHRLISADKQELMTYTDYISKVLEKGNKWDMTSLAIALLGTGGFIDDDKKLRLVSQAFLAGICDFTSKTKQPKLKELHLINISPKTSNILTAVFTDASQTTGSQGEKPFSEEKVNKNPESYHRHSSGVLSSTHKGSPGSSSGRGGFVNDDMEKFPDSDTGNHLSLFGTTTNKSKSDTNAGGNLTIIEDSD